MTDPLILRRPITSIGSSDDISLSCPNISYLTFRKRTFSYIFLSLFNSLHNPIHSYTSFIKHLKAYIYILNVILIFSNLFYLIVHHSIFINCLILSFYLFIYSIYVYLFSFIILYCYVIQQSNTYYKCQ